MGKKSVGLKVYWSDTSKAQLKHVYAFWVSHNGSETYSKRLKEEAFALLEMIAKNPKAFKRLKDLDVREAPMGNFSIFYSISNGTISVVSFWDNRQNPKLLRSILEAQRGIK
jgi:plasmid stabilization system protein ParE